MPLAELTFPQGSPDLVEWYEPVAGGSDGFIFSDHQLPHVIGLYRGKVSVFIFPMVNGIDAFRFLLVHDINSHIEPVLVHMAHQCQQ